ncbi:hypothetical protein FACS189452_04510 [Bacteroidia bacterium]|nr:hypothetical protein FACS189452_04510 [Bacteroidia bacterium]GHT81264.1 hypothetical protein FACS189467_5010 [Bacteroidia bacterium]
MANVRVIKEVIRPHKQGDWNLHFQWCEYVYEDGRSEYGYRFIWSGADDKIRPQRGQARIPSLAVLHELLAMAAYEGWLGIVEKNNT